jgi:uncharacterized membrane protein YbhN (UPF0104 family)
MSTLGHALNSAVLPWIEIGLPLAVGAAVGARIARRRTGFERRSNQFWRPIAGLLRRPAALLTLVAASGLTTLILGFAFAASTAMVPGARPTIALGGLLVAFMLAAAAGNSVPVPAGLGTTEAALIAVLVTAHVPADHAVQVVVIYRLLTFWLPAFFGLLALRHLRRHHAI